MWSKQTHTPPLSVYLFHLALFFTDVLESSNSPCSYRWFYFPLGQHLEVIIDSKEEIKVSNENSYGWERNTTNLGLAFIIAFGDYLKDFVMLFFTGRWCHLRLTLQFCQSVILRTPRYLSLSQLLSGSWWGASTRYGPCFETVELEGIEDLPLDFLGQVNPQSWRHFRWLCHVISNS